VRQRPGRMPGMKRRAYQTDLSDAEWSCIEPHLPAPEPGGRPRVHALREVLNAVFFYVLLRSGCAWRLLPHDLERPGRASTTTSAYGVSTGDGRSSTLCHPSAPPGSPRTGSSTQRGYRGDSQSVKSTGVGGEARGYDGGKQISRGGNVTSWSIRRAFCSRSRSTRPTSSTATG
jgi:putative transposase